MEQLIQAIKVFNSPKSGSEQVRQADDYLKAFERSKESWLLIISVLEQNDLESDEYFLAAKILKTKLEYDFGQLRTEDSAILPEKLLSLLKRFKEASLSVRGQLVDAFIYCYLHMFNIWPDLMEFIKQNFSTDPHMQNYIFLIYEYLPDKVFSKTMVMDEQHQDKMIEFFKNSLQNRILEELNQFARSQAIDERTQNKLLKIMSNWIDFKTNSTILGTLKNHAVFELALQSLNSVELQEYSALAIVGALRQLKKQEEIQKNADLFQMIAVNIFRYFEPCKVAYREKDIDTVRTMSRVFIKFGNRAIPQFMTPSGVDEFSQQFLMNMLEITKYEEVENEEDITQFWENFCLKIQSEKNETHRQTLLRQFSPLIEQLLTICIKKVTYDSEIFELHQSNSPSAIDKLGEEFENKNKQRYFMKQLFGTISTVIGTEETIVYVVNQIKQLGSIDSIQNLSIENASVLEGILYCINQILYIAFTSDEENNDNQEETSNNNNNNQNSKSNSTPVLSEKSISYIFEILTLVLSTNVQWVKLKESIFQVIISSSDFLKQNMNVCQLSFNLIVTQLESELLSEIAETAFEVLCRDCPLFVQANIETFLKNVYSKQMFNYQIIAGISYAICATDEYLNSHLISLCQPYASDLVNYINLPSEQQKNRDVIEQLKKPLKALKNIMSCVPERENPGEFPHSILQEIFKQIWPVLKFIMETQPSQTSLIENIISLLKQFIYKMQVDFDIFFVDFLEQIVILYKNSTQSGILYIVEKCVKIFSATPQHIQTFGPVLKQAFEALVETTLKIIPTIEEFIENPDIIEDFFGFLGRFVKYFPTIFFSSQFILQILQSASTGINLQQKDAAFALFSFIEILYLVTGKEHIEKTQNVRQEIESFKLVVLNQVSYQFNVLLFQQLADVPQREIRNFIMDIFLAQIQIFGSQALPLFQPIFASLPDDILTNSEKDKFLNIVAQTTPESVPKETLNELCSYLDLIGDRFKKSFRRKY